VILFILVYFLLIFLAFSIWYYWKTQKRRRAREAEAERARLAQLRSFALTLSTVSPGLLPLDEAHRLVGPEAEPSHVLVEELLDRFDATDGPIIGRYPATDGNGSSTWPYVAERHEERGYVERDTITPSSLPVVLADTVRNRHVYFVGKSGEGKSTVIAHLALQDAEAGLGFGVIAPEQELLTEELLPFIPEHRLDDVIYINPADTARPVPLNPLHVDDGEDFDRKLDESLTIFHRVIAEDGGTGAPRMETILRFTLATLMAIPGTTLLDIARLLDRTDDTYRKWAAGQVADEEVRQFWASVYPQFPKDAHLSLINRLGRFLQPKVVRAILCSPGGSLNVRRAMDQGKILLFNLSDGVLGEQNAQLLGQLVVAKFQTAAMSRADIPKDARRPFGLYIDEFQSFCGVAGKSYEKMLSRSRKYSLRLNLAHQQGGQIPESVMREILGNVGSLVIFRVGATDARRLGRELAGTAPRFDYKTLTSLPKYQACCLLDRTLLTIRTNPPPKNGSDAVRDEAIRRSRERYGVDPVTARRPRRQRGLDDLGVGDVF